MWHKNLLTKCGRVCMNLQGWSRYMTIRKYSNANNIDNIIENTSGETQEEKVKKLLDDAANFNEATDTSWASNPYPEGVTIPSEEPARPIQDPKTASILLFPGQGTLHVGQVKPYLKIPRARELFDIAKEVLGFDLLKLCLTGPQEELNRTEYNQIATVITSLAALEKLWEDRPLVIDQCKAAIGYSVGELTALIFSGVLTLEDGLRLAAVRGAAMQYASDLSPQGMLLINCLSETNLGVICKEATKWAMDMGVSEPVCKIAIYMYAEGKILAGSEEALKYVENNYNRLKIRRPIRIPVSSAFHTPLMAPAIKSFKKALDKIEMEYPRIDTYSNYTAKIYHNPEQIRKLLVKQIVSPVKWEQIMHNVYAREQGVNFPRTFEVGSRGSLKNTLKRINLKASNSCFAV